MKNINLNYRIKYKKKKFITIYLKIYKQFKFRIICNSITPITKEIGVNIQRLGGRSKALTLLI